MQAPSLERPTRPWQYAWWHLAALAVLVAVPAQFLLGTALPGLPAEQRSFLIVFAIVYAGAALLLGLSTRGARSLGVGAFILIVAAALGSWALWLLLTKADYARPLLLVLCVGAAAALLASLLLPRGVQVLLATLALAATLGLQAANERPRSLLDRALGLGPKPVRSQGTINTAYYALQAVFYDRYFEICTADRSRCDTPRTGGAIANFADGLLYATGEGQLHFVATDAGRTLETRRLATDVPINDAEFAADGANERDLSVFRVMDILPRERDGRYDLLASHHHWDADRRCFTMRVSRLTGTTADLLAGEPQADWQTVWDAEPCLPLKMNNGNQKQFGGDGAGGRMLMRGEDTLLIAIGDQQWDGWNYDRAVSQDPASAYGKLIAIDLATGEGRILASGLRNPEGFHEDEQGRLWETEHGPQGGDELNLLVEGGNYGWPLATYGNEYGTQDWPLRRPDYDDDPAFKRPIYAWLPSLGMSQLTTVKSPLFPRWRGDFLILTLNASLQRAHVKDERVIVVEPIRLRERNGRLRDIEQLPDGRLAFLIDGGAFAFVSPLDAQADDPRTRAARGAMLFSACQQCHRIGDGRDHAVGPDLRGVAGRPIAQTAGYAYSEALRALGGRWSDERLDAFLRDPQAFAPGTAMQIRALGEADDRAALIAYLKSLQ
ncbi:MAG: PQQ-dependent sugar dehydrogenase [Gammaproteobacteria bacterium]